MATRNYVPPGRRVGEGRGGGVLLIQIPPGLGLLNTYVRQERCCFRPLIARGLAVPGSLAVPSSPPSDARNDIHRLEGRVLFGLNAQPDLTSAYYGHKSGTSAPLL